MTEETNPPPSYPPEESLPPLTREFWFEQALRVLGIGLAIYLAAHFAFSETTRFSKSEDFRQARATLAVMKTEFDGNLAEIKAARDRIRADQRATITLRTAHLEIALTRGYMCVVDPLLLAEIKRLFSYPLSIVIDRLRDSHLLEGREREYHVGVLDRLIAHAENVIVPMLRAEDAKLQAAERRLQEGD